MKRFLIPAIALFSLASCCHKDSNTTTIQADIVRIQQYGGMMPVHRAYEISDNAVKEDTSSRKADTINYYFNVVLADDKYQKVAGLLREIPMALLKEESILLGDPKFEVDGTATYVVIYREGRKHTYLLADNIDSLPEYLRGYALKIHQAFADLK